MAYVGPIDESPVRNTASSINSRILPDWAISNDSKSTGRQDPSPSSKRQIVVHGSSSHSRILPAWAISNDSKSTGRQDPSSSSSKGQIVAQDSSINSRILPAWAISNDSKSMGRQDPSSSSSKGQIVAQDSSINSRILPAWAISNDSKSMGRQDPSSSKGQIVAQDSSINSRILPAWAISNDSKSMGRQDPSSSKGQIVAQDSSINSRILPAWAISNDSKSIGRQDPSSSSSKGQIVAQDSSINSRILPAWAISNDSKSMGRQDPSSSSSKGQIVAQDSSINSRILPAWAISNDSKSIGRLDPSSSSKGQIVAQDSSINSRILPAWAISNDSKSICRQDPSSSKGQIVAQDSSINSRILPAWAISNDSNLTGRQGPSSKKQIVSHDEVPSTPHKRLNTSESVGASSSRIDDSVYQKNGLNNSGRLVTSHNIHSSHQPMKRSLLTSLQSSLSNVRPSNPVETVGASEIRDAYVKSAAWSNPSNGKNSMGETSIWGSGDNSSLYEKKGNRLLPPSLMPGKHTSHTPFSGPIDPFHHTGVGEENPAGADERFVFQAAVQDLHQPKVGTELPEGLLSVSLLRHQKIALAWMLNKESSDLCRGGILADDQGLGKTVSMIALIQMQKTWEANLKHIDSCNRKTEALNLDDDGSSGSSAFDVKESDDFTIIPQASNNTIKGFHSRRPAAGTLIVCPASVLRQWARELDEKVTRKAKLSVLIYHGGNRTKDPAALAKYDSVLTTYAIVTNEVPKQPLVEEEDDDQKDGERYGLSSAFSMEKKRKKSSSNKKSKKGKENIDMSAFDSDSGTLARVKWSRVVLDESQTIKNHRTQVARACCSLRAKRRWCLSGTPIQNSVDELFSYFRFLRYVPYNKYKIFGSSIKSFILRDSTKGYKKLQVVLRNIMLRRTKGTLIDGEPIINLPPKTVHLTRVEFTIEERTFYDKLELDSRRQFKAYAAAGTVIENYANILLMLLRLRQACDHPLLVKGLNSDPVGKVSSQMAQMLPREILVNLLKQLETSMAICLICRDPPENTVVTMCGHVFCYQCVSDHLTGEDNTCPAPECKQQLDADVVYSSSTLKRCISDDIDGDTPAPNEVGENSIVLKSNYVSSKIKSALEIIKSHCISKSWSSGSYNGDVSSSAGRYIDSEGRGPEKAIVFSQWTSMLDLVGMSLKNSCISYRRLDGTMSIAARDKAVKDFNTNPEVDVMLMSLKAGNLGLNMVAACRVILLDLWWNPTTEDQAVDRAHRIGQTRPVTVSRLTIKDTVEDRILALQEDKRKMVASAFGEDQSGGQGTRLTVDDLSFLFEGR